MNGYEQRQEDRRERYRDRADKASKEASRRGQQALDRLPDNGQPILVGHHSEKRHRRAIEKSDRDMQKAVELNSKAAHYRSKAAGVGRGGISSDDPEATTKLREKLATLERERDAMKAVNAAWRKAGKPGVGQEHRDAWKEVARISGQSPTLIIGAVRGITSYEPRPFPSWQISNLGARIRDVAGRISLMEVRDAEVQLSGGEDVTLADDEAGTSIVDAIADNRLRVFFPGKPNDSIRADLKSHGFHWSRTEGCWQRHRSNQAIYHALRITGLTSKDDE